MSFRTSYPFDFCLLNSKAEDVFYLEDKVDGVTLQITNQLAIPMQLSARGEKPDRANYHFALKFRPDVLNDAPKGEQTVGDWKISDAAVDAQGCSVLYLLYGGSAPLVIGSKSSLQITFTVDINGNKGSRSTNVELLGNNIGAGDAVLENSTRQINWTLINHRGKAGLPLQLSFKDADTILNDGVTPNSLSLRISNTSKADANGDKAVEFNENSRILFFFDPNENPTAASLASVDDVRAIIVKEVAPDKGLVHFAGASPSGQEPLPVWSFTVNTSAGLRLLPMINGNAHNANLLSRPTPALLKVTNARQGILKKKANNLTNKSTVRMGQLLYKLDGDDGDICAPISGEFHFTVNEQDFQVDKPLAADCQIGYIISALGQRNKELRGVAASVTYLDFSFENIVTNYISGKTRLSVRLENIPGYWDETFVLHIDKQPLVFHDQHVGIGTNAPKQKLQVTVNKSGLNFPLLLNNRNGEENNGNAVGLAFLNEGNATGTWYKAGIVHERTAGYGVGSLKFLVNSHINNTPVTLADARLTIASDGNVGVGTSAPASRLSIGQLTRISESPGQDLGELSFVGFNRPRPSASIQALSKNYDDTGHLLLKTSPNGNGAVERLRIEADGNVGIGTDEPATRLDVRTDDKTAAITVGTKANGGSGGALYLGNANHGLRRGYPALDSNNHVGLYTTDGNVYLSGRGTDTYQFVLTKNGNVGIGTDSPDTKLDVNGDVKAGNITIKNNHLAYDSHNAVINWGNQHQGALYLRSLNTQGDINTYRDVAVFTAEGRLGIGTPTPIAPLHVKGVAGTATQGGGYTFFNPGGGVGASTVPSGVGKAVTAYFEGGEVWVNSFVVAGALRTTSDRRIKRIIGLSDRATDLGLLNRIRVTDYTYIDQVNNTPGVVKKVIAQEVEKVLPTAVTRSRQALPNVYERATQVSYANGQLTVTTAKPHELPAGGRMRFYTATNQSLDPEVTVVDAHTVRFASAEAHAAGLFVYGKYVDDFRSVDYDALAMLNVSATQELARQVAALQQQNAALQAQAAQATAEAGAAKAQAATATASLDTFEARLRRLEAATGALLER